jgi:hypothetical protein
MRMGVSLLVWVRMSFAMMVMGLVVLMRMRVLMAAGRNHLGRHLLFPIHQHIDFGRRNPAAIDLRNFQSGADIERGHCFLEHVGRHASIDQGAQEHVAAHAGKTIEVSYAHDFNCGAFIIGNAGMCVKPAMCCGVCYNHFSFNSLEGPCIAIWQAA